MGVKPDAILIISAPLFVCLILLGLCTAGCTTVSSGHQNISQANLSTPTESPIQVVTASPGDLRSANYPTTSTYVIPTSTTKSLKDRNIETVKGIVEEYHRTHTYSLSDMYVCAQMAQDVWNMVETQKINAIIKVGGVDEDVTAIKDANHAWVLAEVSPGEWIAMETTGGYLVCPDSNVCAVNNPRYYVGWSFNSPKELQEYLDAAKHPCSNGYVLGNDNLCHPACGGNSYCTGNTVCVNGQCRGCSAGYILGDDFQCHVICGSSTTYCTGDSFCVNGECRRCNAGYIFGNDNVCHPECGVNTYCTGDSICVNGQCRGCDPGYYIGTDLRCHKV